MLGKRRRKMGVETLANVECTGVEKRHRPTKHYVYLLRVKWSTQKDDLIFRGYTAFFDFLGTLQEEFKGRKDVNLPELPVLRWFERGLLGGTKDAAEKRKKYINDFCEQILKLPADVVAHHTVTSFFETWPSDLYDITHSKKTENHSKRHIFHKIESHSPTQPRHKSGSLPVIQPLQSGLNSGSMECLAHAEYQYIASSDYSRKKEGEVNLRQGELVDVLETHLSGWWFVHLEDGGQGWAPGAFLEPLDPSQRETNKRETGGVSGTLGRFTTLCDCHGEGEDEISYRKGEEVEVVNTSTDGWWKIQTKDGRSGVTPAMNLRPIEVDNSHSNTDNGDVVLMHTNSIYKRTTPPRRNSQVSLKDLYAQVNKPKKAQPVPQPPAHKSQPPVPQKTDLSMYNNSPPLNKKQTKKGEVLYTEIVFDDEEKDKPRMVIRQDSGVTYSQILPSVPKKSPPTDGRHAYENVHLQNSQYENVKRDSCSHLLASVGKTPHQPQTYVVIRDYSPHMAHRPGTSVKAGDLVNIHQEEGEMCYCTTTPNSPGTPREGWLPRDILQLNSLYFSSSGPLSKGPNGKHKPTDLDLQHSGDLDVCIPVTPSPPRSGESSPTTIQHESPSSGNLLVTGRCDFIGPGTDRILSFKKGDQMSVIRYVSNGWAYIQLNSQTGWVPSNYLETEEGKPALPARSTEMGKPGVKSSEGKTKPDNSHHSNHHSSVPLASEQWFVGKMPRQTCETLLLSQGHQRAFVIRESTNRVGDFTLSVRFMERVRHFPIELTKDNKYYIGQHHFKEMSKVVEYYRQKPLFFGDNKEAVSLGDPLIIHKS